MIWMGNIVRTVRFHLYCLRLKRAQRSLIRRDLEDCFSRFRPRKEIKIKHPDRLAIGMERINRGAMINGVR